ncbi:hypothetical protein [Aliiglaciecola litoralis]
MESLRKVTYPPDFKYTEPSKLRSEMGQLAQQMRMLDEALNERPNHNDVEIEEQRQQVLSALAQIERIASRLQSGNSGANHPFMQDYMDTFVSQVGEARVAASLPEPRYYFAGKISGGCTSCHRINR